MRSNLLSTVALALAATNFCTAQTFTTCDPTKKSCPADKALGKTITVDFTKGASSEFNLAEGTNLTYDGTNGALFTINKETEAPTITSNWYIFFGKVDVVLKGAPGQGIVSSFVMESDDLDEIDWEWLGGDTTQVETNYFGKGNTSTYDRATYETVSNPIDAFHTYTIDWDSTAIKWSIDGNLVRTLAYGDANGGANFPQTPMQVKMGNWVGGSSTSPKGTVQWAGGLADFSKAPFVMQVKSVTIQDYSSAKQYMYGDMSGSWQSIKTDGSASDSSSGSSSSSSSGSSTSASASASTKPSSTAAPTSGTSSAASSTFSTVSTAPVASGGGLGAGAVTASVTSSASVATANVASATTTGAASSKPSGSAGTALKVGSSYAMAIFALGLYHLVV